mmetsp:Transcript_2441/g.8925  ORF Transcript_2441/g.8925 Transcript_2441/m.8925 type:complete len:273 (-) Transcript_2441:341-1159(-)
MLLKDLLQGRLDLALAQRGQWSRERVHQRLLSKEPGGGSHPRGLSSDKLGHPSHLDLLKLSRVVAQLASKSKGDQRASGPAVGARSPRLQLGLRLLLLVCSVAVILVRNPARTLRGLKHLGGRLWGLRGRGLGNGVGVVVSRRVRVPGSRGRRLRRRGGGRGRLELGRHESRRRLARRRRGGSAKRHRHHHRRLLLLLLLLLLLVSARLVLMGVVGTRVPVPPVVLVGGVGTVAITAAKRPLWRHRVGLLGRLLVRLLWLEDLLLRLILLVV